MKKIVEYTTVEVKDIESTDNERFFWLVLSSPGWKWIPGQFIMIRPQSWEYDPFLARPFSIANMNEKEMRIFFQVVGRGTQKLAQLNPGDRVNIWGPLGRGFKIDYERPLLLIAGGIGLAPFIGIIKNHPHPENVELIFGHRRDIKHYPISEISRRILVWCVQDKSQKDLERLRKAVRVKIEGYSPEGQIFACGPLPFLKMIHDICSAQRASVQVSLERPMACGIGVCMGCSIPGQGESSYHVCTQGPVFFCNELDINRLIT